MPVAETSELLERADECVRLGSLLQAACGCEGAAALIEAGPGLGKSRLVDWLAADAAHRGMRVLFARGSEFECGFAFGVVRQLLERPVLSLTPADRERALSGSAGLAAGALGPPRPRSAPADPGARLHGLFWLVANLAERTPTLVAVDDAHWADGDSLRFLLYLLHRLRGLPVAVTVAARPTEQRPHAELLRAVGEDRATVRIVPRPLGVESVATIVARRLGPGAEASFCAACHAATGGNPFLLQELLTELEVRGIAPTAQQRNLVGRLVPTSVARPILARLAQLPTAAQRVARAAATLREGALLRDTARLAELPLREAAAAADALVACEILASARPVRFAHPLVRAAVHDAIPAGERALEHARAADLLQASGAPLDDIAGHLLRTEPNGRVATVARLRAAAAEALARGSPKTAAAYLRRALAEPPPDHIPDVLHELGRAAAAAHEPDAAEHLEAALELESDPHARAVIAMSLAQRLAQQDRHERAVGVLDRARAALDEHDREIRLRLEATTIGLMRERLTLQSACRDRLARVDGRLEGRTPAELVLLLQLAVEATMQGRDADWAADVAERALREALIDDPYAEDQPLRQAINAVMRADRLSRARGWYDRVLADARAAGSASRAAVVLCHRSHVAYRSGRLADAEADARSALEIAGEPDWWLRPAARAYLADALIERDRLDDAADVVAEAGPAAEVSESWYVNPLLLTRGRLALECGDAAKALDALLACGRRQAAWEIPNPAWLPWRSAAAFALHACGRPAEARALAAEEHRLATAFGTARATAIALRAQGLIEGGETGCRLLREAVERVAPSEARLEHARALTDLGAALRRANRRTEARRALHEALGVARDCDAQRIALRATAELRAAGSRPRSVPRSGVDALTPSERRIADMAAQDMSNPEIAQALFVTVKTVEGHLSSAYRKLGVSSRAKLRAALGSPAG